MNDTTWSYLMSLEGSSPHTSEAVPGEWVVTFILADGRAVGVFLEYVSGGRAELNLGGVNEATPLLVHVERHPDAMDPVRLEFVVADAGQGENRIRDEYEWGTVYWHPASTQETLLGAIESVGKFVVAPGAMGRIEAVSVGTSVTVGGTAEFAHDGSARTVVMRPVPTISGRLVDEAGHPLQGVAELTWRESGREHGFSPRRAGGSGRKAHAVRLSESGEFSIEIVAPWYRVVPMEQVLLEVFRRGYETQTVIVEWPETRTARLGEVTMVAAGGTVVRLIATSTEQRDALATAVTSGIRVSLWRNGEPFSSNVHSVEEIDTHTLGLLTEFSGPDDSGQASEFGAVRTGDTGYLSLLKGDTEELVRGTPAGELLIVTQTEYEVDFAPTHPVTLEWHWPGPEGKVWSQVASGIGDGENAQPVRFRAPTTGVWLVWRQGDLVEGQKELVAGPSRVRVP